LAIAVASPQYYAGFGHPLAYNGLGYNAYAAAPVVAPAHTSSQYHAQDELGQYSYGYAGGPSSKSEVKTADGVTRGSYSYVDANNIVQTVNYVADPVNGFRVAATNLPVAPAPVGPLPVAAHPVAYNLAGPVHIAQLPIPVDDTPEVKAAKVEHFRAHAEAKARAALP